MDYLYDDALIPVTDIQSTSSNSIICLICDIQTWNRDLFMGTLPNSQYGDAATIMINFPVYATLSVGGLPPSGRVLLIW